MIREQIIFWDWNGTLLNDAITCMVAMNDMLARRGLSQLNMDLYKNIFGFPVKEYYRKLGFNFKKESFEDLSVEFINAYSRALDTAQLTNHARRVLKYFYKTGKRNIIISAMKQDMLIGSVNNKKLMHYFTDILGIDNIYAASKSAIACEFVSENAIDVSDVVLIGDTTHDFEVAKEIGCRCILVADGHQSEERLLSTGVEVVSSLSKLIPGRKQEK
jgi:phosphoglycolate phosphatase